MRHECATRRSTLPGELSIGICVRSGPTSKIPIGLYMIEEADIFTLWYLGQERFNLQNTNWPIYMIEEADTFSE